MNRQYLSRCSAVLLSCACIAQVPAAEEFTDAVPVALVKALVGNTPWGETALYDGIPDTFPPVTLPATFTVLGSSDNALTTRAVLRSTDDMDVATAAAATAFEQAGWSELVYAGLREQQGGFVSLQPVSRPRQLCHDDYGSLSVSSQAVADATMVTISLNKSAMFPVAQPSCTERQTQIAASRASAPRFFQQGGVIVHMPRLELPVATGPGRVDALGPPPAGFGGSMDDYEARSSLRSDLALAEVYQHFAEQLVAQEWTLDGESSGEVQASGTWRKRASNEDDSVLDMAGTLTVLALGDESYDLRFRLVALGGEGDGTGIPVGIRGLRPVNILGR